MSTLRNNIQIIIVFLFDIHNAFSAKVNILEVIIVAISMFDVMLFKRMLSLM